MKIELRNVSHTARLSEETPAYAADLYVDGRKVATTSNRGCGGCDDVRWLPGTGDVEGAVDAYFASLPPVHFDGKDLPQTLESFCHGYVAAHSECKRLRRYAANSIVGLVGDKILRWKAPPSALAILRGQLVEKNPGVEFVNDMTDDRLRAVIMRAA